MDLYADLPLAKGASSSALDADGKLKTSGSSVWATKTAPAFVPQVMRNSANQQQGGRGRAVPPPAIATKSPVAMVPAALRSKSPHGTAGSTSASPAGVKSASGISIAFKPASVTRRSATPQTAAQQKRMQPSPANGSINASSQPAISSLDSKLDDAEARPRGLGFGFSSVTTTTTPTTATQARIAKANDGGEENQQSVVNAATGNGAGGAHFFQSNYRDEYNPARPNSYEAYCEERLNRKKLEQVKRELERRQQEQEREGKLEREKLVRDIEAGNAPAVDLPAAGRGRGMTMPAWMRKKMEETAAAKQVDAAHAQQVDASPEADQFEDAAPCSGLGFAGGAGAGLGFARSEVSESYRRPTGEGFRQSSIPASVQRDEFGREMMPSGARHAEARDEHHQHKRSRDDQPAVTAQSRSQQQQQLSDSGRPRASHDGTESSASYKRPRELEETGARAAASTTALSSSRGCVILLKNMVGAGEVDDELQDEVKEECAEKYGPVVKCLIYEVTARVPPEEAVRIFVQFQRQSDAEKARLGLNARFFGGRKVQASYYDDDKFRRLDLTA